jgi:conjugal transfer mating pair stabilization protein TraN
MKSRLSRSGQSRWTFTRRLTHSLAGVLVMLGTPAIATPECVKDAEVCIEGPETRSISGYPVYRDCWRTQSQYRCVSARTNDDCQSLQDRGCSQVGSDCLEATSEGVCMVYEQSWQCKTASGTSSTVTSCGDRRFCLEGRCFDTSHAPDPDFARAVTGLEVQRQTGQYVDPSSLEIFKGYDNRCRKKLFGLVNCCKGGGTSGSLFSAWALISGAGGQALGAVGSSYTYDALFAADAPDLLISGFESLFGAGGGSSALAGVIAGELTVESFITTLVPGPWTLAMLAIQLSGLLSCEEAEQILAMKKDNKLCHSVGSYCSIKVPLIGTCLQTTQTYCCFNSRLARIINEQGRPQVGRSWGAAKSPSCSGFTVAQLQALDFSRMDLTEFYAEIAPRLPNASQQSQWGQQVQQRIQNAVGR